MGETKHAPLPWKLAQHGLTPGSCLLHDWHIEDADGKLVGWIPQRNRASADLIVRACNSHAELVEALAKIANHTNAGGQAGHKLHRINELARAAIAKAQRSST